MTSSCTAVSFGVPHIHIDDVAGFKSATCQNFVRGISVKLGNVERLMKKNTPSLTSKIFKFRIHAASSSTPSSPSPFTPFHLAFPVNNLKAAREFYGGILGCPEGRSAKTWVDYNLFGHQIVCHVVPNYEASKAANAVDGDPVPVPHFGLAMTVEDFQILAEKVKNSGIKFIIEPHIRFQGQPGEQWTMFFKDPSGNSLEFKAMTNPQNLFAKYAVSD